ncbi:MAG: hypothetical protein A3E80_00510 [Chlamydiae bacterium RIFCSPHIGHO2_12_FULL_49_9]|nr:MAG: hypothetical protein A3E80_00510 [Chlamydiae bacterium RIFCSPHIGHO2_12_FULL_49_9]
MANSLTPLSYHLGQANFALARFGTYYEELCEISNQLESKKKGWIRIATDLGKKTLDAEEIKQGLPEDVRYCYQIEKTRDFALGIFTELNKVLALCQQVSSEYTNALRTLDSPPEIIKSKFTYIPNIKEPRKNEINSLLDELNEKNHALTTAISKISTLNGEFEERIVIAEAELDAIMKDCNGYGQEWRLTGFFKKKLGIIPTVAGEIDKLRAAESASQLAAGTTSASGGPASKPDSQSLNSEDDEPGIPAGPAAALSQASQAAAQQEAPPAKEPTTLAHILQTGPKAKPNPPVVPRGTKTNIGAAGNKAE